VRSTEKFRQLHSGRGDETEIYGGYDEIEFLHRMESEIRTVVTFESTAFNMTKPKDYFINPCCFGDDVGAWIIRELRKRGVRTDDKPGQEDFGWYLNFEIAGIEHTFVIGHQPKGETEAGTWIGWLERKHGLFASMLGRRNRGIQASAAQMIHDILSDSEVIRDVRWHFRSEFDGGTERGASSPVTPK
jgi:hypothetical protein